MIVMSGSQPTDRPERLLLRVAVVLVAFVAGMVARRSRRTNRFAIVLVGAALLWGLALQSEASHELPSGLGWVGAWLALALLVCSLFRLPQGRSAPGRDRRLVEAAATLAALLFAGLVVLVGAARPSMLNAISGICIVGVAGAVVVAFVRRRLLIADVLGRLSLTLGSAVDVPGLRQALASALGDEELQLRVLGDDNVESMPADELRAGRPDASGRASLEISDGGTPVAVLSFDAALGGDDELVDAIATQTRDALKRLRVTGQLERSRSRIAVAAAEERARIERDLHDGAQQRLIALRIKLSIADELLRTDRPAGERAVQQLGSELDLALEDVCALARGIYPSALADHGLEAALRGLELHSPLPVSVSSRRVTRHSPVIESALYFTCVEALQNATKHARGASGVWISLCQSPTLSLEVRDDGSGFVPRPAGFGRGLRNMADRMEAVGGQLTIDSEPGRGTRVLATITVA